MARSHGIRLLVDEVGVAEMRRLFKLFDQANEVIDELQTQVDDLTEENNELRRRSALNDIAAHFKAVDNDDE